MPVRSRTEGGIHTYDAIIVGGRVAGSVTATLLAQRKWRVLLLDRAPLPSPAVSTHFFGPSVLAFLEELGILDKVRATGAPPLAHWHLHLGDNYYGGPMLPRAQHPYNLCVRRDSLDDILLRRAAEEPLVEVRDRTAVRTLLRQGDQVTGVAGAGWEEKARVVIGADGRGSLVAQQLGAEPLFDAGALRCTFHAYWHDVHALPEPSLELWHDDGDVIQMGPCDGDQWVVMVSVPPERFKQMRADGGAGYEQRLRAIPAMRARLRTAERVSQVFAGKNLRNFHRPAAGAGWRLVGDALCHKDPLFGAGIADAVSGSRALAQTLDDALSGRVSWEHSASQYMEETETKIVNRMRQGLEDLTIQPPAPSQRAWIRSALGHPGLAFELAAHCSRLFEALPADRQAFWQRAADSTAEVLGLPQAARLAQQEQAR
ncbi:FAD-dependent monooxygenase [Streptomyces sp. NA02950]|uniref:NAD(P)/FAD-dependent oxidoreductase n=1 Tax=Streptomyces sp. NA02950 TaxID=2742137 RepID=UPI00158FF114|nr:NAD(P)/FAD-dependent oxidoreductase [Streptomyces sp. NA02950]QKV92997.1 FAD-dependent monooxygenase [Streptomyces sp. NA02950]